MELHPPGVVPSRPGGAGLRGCSGRVVRAAGSKDSTKYPLLFSVGKTLEAPVCLD